MKPVEIKFYVYAEDDMDAVTLNKALYDLVNTKREQGIAVTAKKLTEAIEKYKDNFFLNRFLKSK